MYDLKFSICDNNRKSCKSSIIERLEDRTQSDVEYPESFIGIDATIKNVFKTKNSFIIFESNKEKYTSKLYINKVNKYGLYDNRHMLESNHFLSSFVYIIITFGSFAIFDVLFSITLPLYMIFVFGMFLITYLILLTRLHQTYEPVIKNLIIRTKIFELYI